MATESRPDLVLFVGPVDLAQLQKVVFDRPTEVYKVSTTDNSAAYRVLGSQPLAQTVQLFTGKSIDSFKNITISAFSKGGSFTDEVLKDPEALSRVDAVILNDAVFGSQHDGMRQYLEQSVDGGKLMVVTNTNNQASANLPKRARESVEELLGDEIGLSLDEATPGAGMPVPSGGVWKSGDFVWYDYVQPSGVNDISHAAHHALAANTWTAHLVPYFSGPKFNVFLAAASLVTMAGFVVWLGGKKL